MPRRLAALLLALLPALPGHATGPQSAQTVASAGPVISAYERHLADLINEYRAHRGLAPLVLVPDLNAIAIEHSAQMAQQRRLSHDGFQQRFDRTGAQLCVENVGWNFPHAEAQLDGWRASEGHHRNLLEPRVARMGIARARTFVTFFACS